MEKARHLSFMLFSQERTRSFPLRVTNPGSALEVRSEFRVYAVVDGRLVVQDLCGTSVLDPATRTA